jgi:2-oxoglutarate dehydrogenase E2 component (dihydrolipoamide succinyltransferase)
MDAKRRAIAEHMVRSAHTSPHVTSIHEIDMTRIALMRATMKGAFQKREGFNLTFTPFIALATAQCLREFPWVNASVDGDRVLLKKKVNLGIAVALEGENGLIVPVVKNADGLNFVGMARAIQDLADKARIKKLAPDDVAGGTFTITNIGRWGTLCGTPIISQPQVAILGPGAIQKRVVVIDGAIAIRDMMYITLSYDHRVVDGMLAGKFLSRLTQLLEQFDETQVP